MTTRFIPQRLVSELLHTWHASRIACADITLGSRHARLTWTTDRFSADHPELGLSTTAIWKDLSDLVSHSN